MRTAFSALASLLIVASFLGAAVPEASSLRHFELARSLPAAESQAPRPSAVVLWFTQRPQDGVTTVRVLDAGGAPVPAAELVQDPADPTVFLLPVPEGLAPGSYTVAWRSMAADGHPVRGEFSFTSVAP